MKKLHFYSIFTPCILLFFGLFLAGCGQDSAQMSTMESFSADSVVSYINDSVKAVDTTFILSVPDDHTDGEFSITPYLSLTLEEGEDGLLDKIELLCTRITDRDSRYSAGFYSSILINALTPDISDEFEEFANDPSDMSWDSNDTIVTYVPLSDEAFRLSFVPKSDYMETKG